jgi:hypothetical protein
MPRPNQRHLSAVLAVAYAVAALTLVSHSASAAVSPGQVCAAAKIRAAAKKAKVQLGCYATATLRGVPVDQKCLSRAGAALVNTFQKAELKGGCATAGDAAATESTVDAFVSTIAGSLPAVPPPTATPTRTRAPTATPSATTTPTETATGVESTSTPTLTPTPGPGDCCQSDQLCGPPRDGACPGAVPVFNASCSGSSGQCVPFTPTPTNTVVSASTPTPTETSTQTAMPTSAQTP